MPDQSRPPAAAEDFAPGIRTPAGFTRAIGELRRVLSDLDAAGLSDAALAAALLTETLPRLVAAHGESRCADILNALSVEMRLDRQAAASPHPRLAS